MDKSEDNKLLNHMLSLVSGGEEAGQDAADRLREFIDKLPGGFFIYYSEGNEEIVYANRALVRMFKCDSFKEFRDYTGNSFRGLVYHEDLDAVEASIKQQIANNHDDLDYVEYRILRKDGVVRWVEDYGHFVRTPKESFFYVFISDATDKITRRNSERDLLLSEKNDKEKKLQTLIEEYDKERLLIRQEYLRRLEVIEGLSVNYDSILYLDLDADKVLPYRLSNRLAAEFDNLSHVRDYVAFVKEYQEMWVHPDDRKYVGAMLSPEHIRQQLKEKRTYYLNYRCIRNSENIYLQLRLVDVGNGHNVSQIVMGFRNIDDEVLQEMKQKKLLEDALKTANLASVAKNAFLSNMSHDMRTPLNAVFGYAMLAQKTNKDKLVAEYLSKIDEAGKNILELIEKVLELSYIESQDFHLTEEKCDLLGLVRDVYNQTCAQGKKKNVSVFINTSSVKHGKVFADTDKVRQVLSHILVNAVKFTESGGQVNISVHEQESASHEFTIYRFVVSDTGIGMTHDFLKHVFEPFEREKNTTHSGMYGSGLGLTIAKHIVDIMGGSIEAESKVGKGSTFTVTLSFRLQDSGEMTPAENELFLAELKGKKVLLVEDNEINLEIETEMLQDEGLIVEPAENGKIGVEKLKASEPNEYLFVLMDIQMPVMDGWAATEAIRRLDEPAHANIPVIALSANAFESDKRLSLEHGIDEHLTKPIDVPLLLQTVAKILHAKKQKA